MKGLRFHHYGLAVQDFARAVRFHENLNYSIKGPIIDELQEVELMICESDEYPFVELVKPVNEESPVNNYLRRNNEIIYHVCYEITEKEFDINDIFIANRSVCVRKPMPAVLFNNRRVSFYYLPDVGLIEILEMD